MATKKKALQAAAGQAGAGEALNVESVFSTYLYTGNGSTQTITNGIDLDGEGGMVWTKGRGPSNLVSAFIDTERGVHKWISSANTVAETTDVNSITSFNSNGYSLGSSGNWNSDALGNKYASWTFRKAPKFFDVVTYTGDGSSNRAIPHNLGTTVGMLIVKGIDLGGGNWFTYHRGDGTGSALRYRLNDTDAGSSSEYQVAFHSSGTRPTDSEFYVGGSFPEANWDGRTYVAYLFAHNDGDGEFGESGDQDIIKCGSYTGTGAAGLEIDLGFEPQWLLVKASTISGGYWSIYDNMRGLPVGSADSRLHPNRADAENTTFGDLVTLLPNGFSPSSGSNQINQSGDTYIYIAIRRPMKTPESGTEVFAIDTEGSTGDGKAPSYRSPFAVDMSLYKNTTGFDWQLYSRITGSDQLRPNLTDAAATAAYYFDYNNGWHSGLNTTSTKYSWMFKRAPGFFDVVCWTGNGVSGSTISHNLGVPPEMIWYKNRDNAARSWVVLNPNERQMTLNRDIAEESLAITAYAFGDDSTYIAPTSSVFTVGNSGVGSGENYIAYLFASLDGISKVGSYTGNGTSQTIDCGFSTGARFVLIKRSDSTGDWHTFDTERGIVAGNDPRLELNTTNAEDTSADYIDPVSSGFAVTSSSEVNASGGEYIFLAIA
jgi:hypothetical protein